MRLFHTFKFVYPPSAGLDSSVVKSAAVVSCVRTQLKPKLFSGSSLSIARVFDGRIDFLHIHIHVSETLRNACIGDRLKPRYL